MEIYIPYRTVRFHGVDDQRLIFDGPLKHKKIIKRLKLTSFYVPASQIFMLVGMWQVRINLHIWQDTKHGMLL